MTVPARNPRRFWLWHLWVPALVCLATLVLFSATFLDIDIANRWFFDSVAHRFVGAGEWWAKHALHDGGRDVVRVITAGLIAWWAIGRWRATWLPAKWRSWSSMAGYCALSIILTVAIAGLLKVTTNVDCPWDLSMFGGTRPYVHVFADRPDSLPHARCYPGAHASSGFALMCLYFALRERSTRAALVGLAVGLAFGVTFSFAQQARGAHFFSHDLASAFIAWFVSLGVYAWYRARVPYSARASNVLQPSSTP